jgi:peptide deformylase
VVGRYNERIVGSYRFFRSVDAGMKIVNYPHPSLRYPAVPVTKIDARLKQYAMEMRDLMFEHRGLGLAAPQVGLPFKMLVLNLSGDLEKKTDDSALLSSVFLNPAILERKGNIEDEEGCLSFPGLYQKVRRAKNVVVQAYNLNGEALEITASDLPSRAWQHEIDHLLGVLFIDKMSPVGKLASRAVLKDFERDYHKAQERGEIPPDAEILKELAALAATA